MTVARDLSEYELLRIIDFLDDVRSPFDDVVSGARPDASYRIVTAMMRNHLRGQKTIKTALAEESGVPFVTAMRHINQFVEAGQFVLKERTSTGKSFFVEPSDTLIRDFSDYCRTVKARIGKTFGAITSKSEVDDFYFGGSSLPREMVPPLSLQKMRGAGEETLRFLFRRDNYFEALRNTATDLRTNLFVGKGFNLLPLPELYEEIVANSRRERSLYDVICVNIPWVGGLVESGAVQPITEMVSDSSITPLDFSPIVWNAGAWRDQQYGVPIYSTVELFLARRDLMAEAGIAHPRSFDQVIEAGRALSDPARDLHGVAWNAAPGMPVANSFMVFLGCCNASVLNVPRRRVHAAMTALDPAGLVATLETPQALEVLDYMHRLVEVSPPDILSMDWDRRVESFMSGQTAMAYCWSMHAALMEYHVRSQVKRRIAYLEQPKGTAGLNANPLGGFLLMIPANLEPERVPLAFDAIAWMTSPEAMKLHVTHGFPVAPRFSVTADPEAAASSPVVGVVDRLLRRGAVCNWSRPAVPHYHEIEAILGTEIHKALRREVSDREALATAQQRIERRLRVRDEAERVPG